MESNLAAFCDALFTSLHTAGLFPKEPGAPLDAFAKHGVQLLDLLEHQERLEVAWYTWLAHLNSEGPTDLPAAFMDLLPENADGWQDWFETMELADALPAFEVLRRWILEHPSFFANEPLITQLKQELGGRGQQWLYSVQDNILTVSQAEREWEKTNLRANARGRLVMWKIGRDWVTTRLAMQSLYGPPKQDRRQS